jgi:hypothetical protein
MRIAGGLAGLLLLAGRLQAQPPVPRGLVEHRWGLAEATRCVPDVATALARLPEAGAPLGFHPASEGSFLSFLRHWQGVQRIAADDGRWLVATRSGTATGFVIVRMASRDASGGPFRASRLRAGRPAPDLPPPPMDRVLGAVRAEPGLEHAGGPQLAGHLLAVPYEARGDSSAVVFYDVGDPSTPRRIGQVRGRARGPEAEPAHASLAALVRLADRRWLLVVGERSSKLLTFYRSADSAITDPPAFVPLRVDTEGVEGGFQNLNLLTQCDGELFLVGMHNTGFPPPSLGHDQLHWYALEGSGEALRLARRGQRRVSCDECNFGAGAGLYVTPAGGLVLYGIGRGLGGPGGTAEVEEFAPAPAG